MNSIRQIGNAALKKLLRPKSFRSALGKRDGEAKVITAEKPLDLGQNNDATKGGLSHSRKGYYMWGTQMGLCSLGFANKETCVLLDELILEGLETQKSLPSHIVVEEWHVSKDVRFIRFEVSYTIYWLWPEQSKDLAKKAVLEAVLRRKSFLHLAPLDDDR